MIIDTDKGQSKTRELKIITTRLYAGTRPQDVEADHVLFMKGSLVFPCGGNTALEVSGFDFPHLTHVHNFISEFPGPGCNRDKESKKE